MDDLVELNELDDSLADLRYPVSRAAVVEHCTDVTLQLADGRENLGDLVADSNQDTFESVDELASEVRNLLPRHAVGEPYQSEGEG